MNKAINTSNLKNSNEIDAIIDALETNSLDKVAKRFGKTPDSIKSKLSRMGMGIREATGFISCNQLAVILGVDVIVPRRWANEKGMPVTRRNILKKGNGNRGASYLIDLQRFWIWAKKNQELLDLTKMNPYEYMPKWAYELRAQQLKNKLPREGKFWTTKELETTSLFLSKGDGDLEELASRLGRSVKAIEKKVGKTPELKAMRDKGKEKNWYSIKIGERRLTVSGVNKNKGVNYLKIKDHPFASQKGLVAEARCIMEQKLGRFLKPEEKVFRYNNDGTDNRPENLYIGKNGRSAKIIGFMRIGEEHLKITGKRESLGYKYMKVPDHPFADKQGYVPEHRLIMEKELGRYLFSWEIVKRKNEDRSDNSVENLYVRKAVRRNRSASKKVSG